MEKGAIVEMIGDKVDLHLPRGGAYEILLERDDNNAIVAAKALIPLNLDDLQTRQIINKLNADRLITKESL